MKAASIGAISAGVAFILVFVGIGTNQAEKIDYQRELEESVSSESTSSTPEETGYQRELEESVSSESISPSAPKEQKGSQSIQEAPSMTP
ncbi:MAG: hypothetical protein ACT4NJ_07175 [Nitrosopumilaceae archaeon]